jgi:hypothetical protein
MSMTPASAPAVPLAHARKNGWPGGMTFV